MDDKLNGVADSAELAADEGALQPDLVTEGGGDDAPKKPLRLDYAQTFKVGFAFAIIMIFWTAYDFVVPLLLEHSYGLDNTIRGLIMGLDNLLSLFMLPLFGKLSDQTLGQRARQIGAQIRQTHAFHRDRHSGVRRADDIRPHLHPGSTGKSDEHRGEIHRSAQ